jgi:hypothetical protein
MCWMRWTGLPLKGQVKLITPWCSVSERLSTQWCWLCVDGHC